MKQNSSEIKDKSGNLPGFIMMFLVLFTSIENSLIYPLIAVIILIILNIISTLVANRNKSRRMFMLNQQIKMISALESFALITNVYANDVFIWLLFCFIMLILSTAFISFLKRNGAIRKSIFLKNYVIIIITIIITTIIAQRYKLISFQQELPIFLFRLIFVTLNASASDTLSNRILEFFKSKKNLSN